MSNDIPANLSAEGRAIHAEAARNKADLSQGTDTVVDTGAGNGGTPPPRQDPFEARKALFLKSNKQHEADANAIRTANPCVDDMVAAMEAESRGEAPAYPHDGSVPRPVVTPPSQNVDPYVTLTYNGRSVTIARTDIERAGGEQMYLRQRQADDIEANLAMQAADMQRQQDALRQQSEQLAARQAEIERLNAASHDGSAQSRSDRTDGQGRATRPGDQAADLDARSIELAAQIYSGEPQDTASAVKTLLLEIEEARREGQRRLDDYKANQTAQAPQPAPPVQSAPVVDPRWEVQRKAINAMGERDYPQLSRDPVLAQRVSQEMTRLAALPQNAQRRAMDVAIEACEAVSRAAGIDARSQVRTMKQGLPSVPSAGGSAPIPAEEQPITNKSYVELLAQRRRFSQ